MRNKNTLNERILNAQTAIQYANSSDVEADEDSERKTGTLNMAMVVKAENNCRVDSTIVTSAIAA